MTRKRWPLACALLLRPNIHSCPLPLRGRAGVRVFLLRLFPRPLKPLFSAYSVALLAFAATLTGGPLPTHAADAPGTSLAWAAQPGAQVLWTNAQPLPTLITGQDVTADSLPAQELQTHLQLLTGQRPATTSSSSPFISLNIQPAGLPVEGYLIRWDDAGRGIVITGADERGLLYGVYDLLEGWGVRWFAPGDYGLVAPRVDTLSMPRETRRTGSPAIQDRGFHICGYGKDKSGARAAHFDFDTLVWMRRNRMNFKPVHNDQYPQVGPVLESMGLKALAFGHSYGDWFTSEDFDGHPEWFALIAGKRQKGAQLCLSNPGLQAETVRRVVALANQNPGLKIISLAPNDGYRYCQCEACLALDTPQDRATQSINRRQHLFTQTIADEAAKQVPGLKVSTLAYANYLDPASNLPAQPALAVSACITRTLNRAVDDPASPANQKVWSRVKAWTQKAGYITFSEYYLSYGGLLPRPYESQTLATIRALRDAGVKGFKSEVVAGNDPKWRASVFHLYLTARALWNPDLNLAALQDDFFANYYGPAAKPAQAIHQIYSDALRNTPVEVVALDARILPELFSQPAIDRLLTLADACQASAAAEPYKSRIADLTAQAKLVAESRLEIVHAIQEASPHAILKLPQPPGETPLTTPLIPMRNRVSLMPEPATMRLAWTDDALIIQAQVTDPLPQPTEPGPVFARTHLDLFICPDPESKVYFQIAASPQGGLYTARCKAKAWDASFKPVIHTQTTQLAPNQWRLTLAIPYASLDTPRPTPGSTWKLGLNVNFREAGGGRHSGWPMGAAFHNIDRFGTVSFQDKKQTP